eukprot:253712-Rhodomonas_salina.1
MGNTFVKRHTHIPHHLILSNFSCQTLTADMTCLRAAYRWTIRITGFSQNPSENKVATGFIQRQSFSPISVGRRSVSSCYTSRVNMGIVTMLAPVGMMTVLDMYSSGTSIPTPGLSALTYLHPPLLQGMTVPATLRLPQSGCALRLHRSVTSRAPLLASHEPTEPAGRAGGQGAENIQPPLCHQEDGEKFDNVLSAVRKFGGASVRTRLNPTHWAYDNELHETWKQLSKESRAVLHGVLVGTFPWKDSKALSTFLVALGESGGRSLFNKLNPGLAQYDAGLRQEWMKLSKNGKAFLHDRITQQMTLESEFPPDPEFSESTKNSSTNASSRIQSDQPAMDASTARLIKIGLDGEVKALRDSFYADQRDFEMQLRLQEKREERERSLLE